MRWNQQPVVCKVYIAFVLAISVPAAAFSLMQPDGDFGFKWVILTCVSVFVSTINVRLPKISSVVSMGDVFVILSLLYFGPGPTLIMYWIDMAVAHVSDVLRAHGTSIRGKILLHRFFFNLSCCSLCVFAMENLRAVTATFFGPNTVIPLLAAIAFGWFVVNTVTVSLAISFWMNKGFWTIWREGWNLSLMNSLGSAAAAGLINLFYEGVDSTVFFL